MTAVVGLLAGGLLAASPAPAAPSKKSAPQNPDQLEQVDTGHVPTHPLRIAKLREAQRQQAIERKLETGRAFKGGAKTAKANGDYVELEREGTDRVFVILAEFGDERYEGAGSADCGPGCFTDDPPFDLPDPEPTTFDGPMHNEIPEPDRRVDNSTLWQEDYDRAHFENMYFNRMAKYYERQSSGRYSVEGDVTEWVKVPYNQALYGRGYCGATPGDPVTSCSSTKALVRDAMAVWVDEQLETKTMAEIREYLRTFDIEDRYDIDLDGNFDEPDGFIDHLQVVHAGGDEASADPTYGSDAIWSHRWYSNLQAGGPGGLTGVNIGSNDGAFGTGADAGNPVPNNPTGIWAGDYTVQPENGGLGVFAHEFAHDLGLDDMYDTSGNTGGAENSTGFWTLMSSGSNIGRASDAGIGNHPTDMSAFDLFLLGWLDEADPSGPFHGEGPFYDVAEHDERSKHVLSTNVPASKTGVQATFVLLPDDEVPFDVGEPDAGEYMFWSGSGPNLENTMTKDGVSGTALTARVNYEIEEEYDYAFLEASDDNGETWGTVLTNLSDQPGHPGEHDPDGNNPDGTGFTGFSDGWTDLTATLPAGTNAIRFRYSTDPLFDESGLRVDNVAIDGTSVGNGETADEGWEFDGFLRTTGTEVQSFFNAYILENRQYDGDDKSLKSAYNFGFAGNRADKVEHFPYQDGMLVSYWNTEWNDNNVGDHPGEGVWLPVDAHPNFTHWKDGTLVRPRISSYDATFGLEATDKFKLHLANKGITFPVQGRRQIFDDSKRYWFAKESHMPGSTHPGRYQPQWYSVKVPKTGTTVRVVRERKNGYLDILVAPKR